MMEKTRSPRYAYDRLMCAKKGGFEKETIDWFKENHPLAICNCQDKDHCAMDVKKELS